MKNLKQLMRWCGLILTASGVISTLLGAAAPGTLVGVGAAPLALPGVVFGVIATMVGVAVLIGSRHY